LEDGWYLPSRIREESIERVGEENDQRDACGEQFEGEED
jgi:hypothetical protein